MKDPRPVLSMLVTVLILSACSGQATIEIKNLALHQPATASKSFVSASAWHSFDGETGSGWSPQASLPQWIQVDLGNTATIHEIRLLVNQPFSSRSLHVVRIGETLDDLRQVQRFDQVTRTGDWLVFTAESPIKGIRYVRIESLEGADWVGWLEVQVLGVR